MYDIFEEDLESIYWCDDCNTFHYSTYRYSCEDDEFYCIDQDGNWELVDPEEIPTEEESKEAFKKYLEHAQETGEDNLNVLGVVRFVEKTVHYVVTYKPTIGGVIVNSITDRSTGKEVINNDLIQFLDFKEGTKRIEYNPSFRSLDEFVKCIKDNDSISYVVNSGFVLELTHKIQKSKNDLIKKYKEIELDDVFCYINILPY